MARRDGDVRGGLATTFRYLGRTENQAAVNVLSAVLNSPDAPLRTAAITALARRKDLASHLALLARFDQLEPADVATLRSAGLRMHGTLRSALLGPNEACRKSACLAIRELHAYELVGALLESIESVPGRHVDEEAHTLVALALQLYQATSLPLNQFPHANPHFARARAVELLADAVDRISTHRRQEIVIAFLTLVPHDHRAVREIFANPYHPAHHQACDALTIHSSPGILRLMLALIKDIQTPVELLRLITSRSDVEFLRYLLLSLGRPIPIRVQRNLGRLDTIAWFREPREALLGLEGAAQAVAVELAVASGMRRGKVFSVLADFAERGQAEARSASIDALADFPGPSANGLVQRAALDAEPTVRAAAVRQLRWRRLPDAFAKVVAMLDSEEPVIREAAREALADHTFVRYITSYGGLSDEERRREGRIVGKVDVQSVVGLRQELKSPSPSARFRAVDLAEHMGLIDEVVDTLIAMLKDDREDLATRSAVAAVLGRCNSPAAIRALQTIGTDAPRSLRQHALAALEFEGGPH